MISYSSANRMHWDTASRIASMPDFLIEPSSFKYFIRRTVDLVLASGSGRAGGGVDDKHVDSVRTDIKHTKSRGVRTQIDHDPYS